MNELCTYSGFVDEPHGGPVCAEPAVGMTSCGCGETIGRCGRHGGVDAAVKVAGQKKACKEHPPELSPS